MTIAALTLGVAAATAQEMLPPAPTVASTQTASDPAAGIDGLKEAVTSLENDYRYRGRSEDALVALMDKLTPLRTQLTDRVGKLQPRLKAIDQRAAQIAPPSGASAIEDPATAAERQRLAERRTELETALQQVKQLSERANSLDGRIRFQRRRAFNDRLFARSASLFDPAFWSELGPSIPAEISGLAVMLSSWGAYASTNGGIGGVIGALAIVAVLGLAVRLLSRWRRRLHLSIGPTPRRFGQALAATVTIVSGIVKIPALVAAIVLVLRNFGLMSDSVAEIGFALAKAALMAGFGRGVANGLFAPGEPDRRIVSVTDLEAASYASHLTWGARIMGLALLANELHRILGASGAALVATGELHAFAILAITVHLLWRIARARFGADEAEPAVTQRGWLRVLLWLCALAMAIGLAAGYVGLAVFVATRMVAAFTVGGAVYVLIAVIDAALTDLLAAGTPAGRSIALAFGLTSRGLDLMTTLASALLRLVVAALAVLLALNASGVFTDDIFSAMDRLVSDYDIGAVHVSPTAILSALACLIVGGLAVRAAQRWLSVKFLPRTGLETGLQNSIVALSGYFALIVVLAVSLGILGIDLQKIALIAGALSVGIGFGLQSVVANFVSGLILLAERTVRVGDWVVVKNEEGFVRRISIRSTEIETFDRASVIIPNQEFITGAVKNWTHNNTVGRTVIKLKVTFDSDLARVRELMLEAAVKHPGVLPGTASVYVMGVGDIGIDVQLYCLIANVSQGLTVRSELYMDILARFHDARVKIPAPPCDTVVPGLPSASVQPAAKIA